MIRCHLTNSNVRATIQVDQAGIAALTRALAKLTDDSEPQILASSSYVGGTFMPALAIQRVD